MSMTKKSPSLPAPSTVMAWEEFVEITGVAPDRLQELLALGWIETRTSATRIRMFRDADIYRGGTIIVDLLERIDVLERTVRGLRGFED